MRLRLAVVDDAVEAHDARPPRVRRRRDARLHEGLELGRGDPRHAARRGEAPLDLQGFRAARAQAARPLQRRLRVAAQAVARAEATAEALA